jgi:hypothetical protein
MAELSFMKWFESSLVNLRPVVLEALKESYFWAF